MIICLIGLGAWTTASADLDNCSTETLIGIVPGDGQIDSWKKTKPPEFYSKDNLWDYINGAAERFLAYEFSCLLVVEYAEPTTPTISSIVEVYDMSTVDSAFGIYSIERHPDYNFIDVGYEGYLEMPILNFVKGRYYVKLTSYGKGEYYEKSLEKFASAMDEQILGESSLPSAFELFPEGVTIPHSQRYYHKDFMTIKGLNNIYTVQYNIRGKEIILFIHPLPESTEPLQIMSSIGAVLEKDGWQKTEENTYCKEQRVIILSPRKNTILGGYVDKEDEETLRLKLNARTP